MKILFRFSVLLAIVSVALMSSCKKDDPNSSDDSGLAAAGKLSPPSWIQGKWAEPSDADTYFMFSSSDIVLSGLSFSIFNGSTQSGVTAIVKETKKTSTLYEVTITASGTGQEPVDGFFSFKKGDGTYIEVGSADTGTTVTNYIRFNKN